MWEHCGYLRSAFSRLRSDNVHRLGYEDFSPPSSPSDSEAEDEADTDSNQEGYYLHDYPENEDGDEDMEGYREAGSDGEWSNDEEEGSDGEGGVWDYR